MTYATPFAAPSALQLDVVPKRDPVSHVGVGSPRRLVRPSGALAGVGSVREIEKLHTVGTAVVTLRLRGRLQKFHAHRRRREVVIAVELDRPIAFCYDLTMPHGFHEAVLFKSARARNPALAVGVLAFDARFASSCILPLFRQPSHGERPDIAALPP